VYLLTDLGGPLVQRRPHGKEGSEKIRPHRCATWGELPAVATYRMAKTYGYAIGGS